MPPRPSKSPAKVRSASPKPTPPGKSPAKATPVPKSAPKSKASEKKAQVAVPDEAAPSAATPKNGNGSSSVPAVKPALAVAAVPPASAATATRPVPDSVYAAGFVGALLALLYVLYNYSTPAVQLDFISAKAFSGTRLLGKGAKGDAIVVFTTKPDECETCRDLYREMKAPAFLAQLETWKREGTLRIGWVRCHNQKNEKVCRDFGASGDEPDSASGYPHVVHFKDGEKVGPFTGEPSLDGFKVFVEDQKKK